MQYSNWERSICVVALAVITLQLHRQEDEPSVYLTLGKFALLLPSLGLASVSMAVSWKQDLEIPISPIVLGLLFTIMPFFEEVLFRLGLPILFVHQWGWSEEQARYISSLTFGVLHAFNHRFTSSVPYRRRFALFLLHTLSTTMLGYRLAGLKDLSCAIWLHYVFNLITILMVLVVDALFDPPPALCLPPSSFQFDICAAQEAALSKPISYVLDQRSVIPSEYFVPSRTSFDLNPLVLPANGNRKRRHSDCRPIAVTLLHSFPLASCLIVER